MRSLGQKRLKAELDRCRTYTRKHNLEFNEKAAQSITETYNQRPELYDPPNIEINRYGGMRLIQRYRFW